MIIAGKTIFIRNVMLISLFLFSGSAYAANNILTDSVGIGTTSPGNKLEVIGSVGVGTTANGYNNAAPANGMIIEGSVGIGTTAPYGQLDVKAAANQHIRIIKDLNTGETGTVGIVSLNDAMDGYTPMGLLASRFSFVLGNVGIGTSNAAYTLDVLMNGDTSYSARIKNANDSGYGVILQSGNTSSSKTGLILTDNSGLTANFYVQNNGAGYLRAANWVYGSDRRMKESIQYIQGGLDKILALKPARFDYISGVKNNLGFIAQDVMEVIPEAVSETKSGMLGLKTDFIIPYLVEATKEQQQEIEDLKREMAELKKQQKKEI